MSETYSKVFFVTGGGTGGHIYPAMAVADALTSDGAKVYYVGNRHNMEFHLAGEKGYKFLHVGVSGMPRKLNPKFFYWGLRLVRAVLYSIKYIKKYNPKAVFATGGYVSAPMIIACIITKTPYMMHDCDAMPGLVTRKLSSKAKYVSLAFNRAKKYIPNKHTIITGNPIRAEFETLTKENARKKLNLQNKLTVTIMGGSQGAKSINNATTEIIKELVQDYNIQVIFQTGRKNYDEITEKLKYVFPGWEHENGIILKPYFTDMISVLKSTDIVVSRAGSLSLSEICASGCASIIIPYPHAAANHQRINAKCLLENGACVYLEDKDVEPNKLRQILLSVIENPMKMNYLMQNAQYMAKFDATSKIVECLNSI
ncbi:MAG: undecaprenyldiphospho-muramoylpentapeptide beta-N-acetylglucosaminyltransferase [bacterium]|nr:undecaprenyldiphospho-muramoylpentapeptide beta-N-acetylglucosaminyltransferase [bacterium]